MVRSHNDEPIQGTLEYRSADRGQAPNVSLARTIHVHPPFESKCDF
jgi:hypothetical protein